MQTWATDQQEIDQDFQRQQVMHCLHTVLAKGVLNLTREKTAPDEAGVNVFYNYLINKDFKEGVRKSSEN